MACSSIAIYRCRLQLAYLYLSPFWPCLIYLYYLLRLEFLCVILIWRDAFFYELLCVVGKKQEGTLFDSPRSGDVSGERNDARGLLDYPGTYLDMQRLTASKPRDNQGFTFNLTI